MKRIHELRIWALSQERTICTVHLGVENKSADLDVLHDISKNLKTQFGFTEVTGTFTIGILKVVVDNIFVTNNFHFSSTFSILSEAVVKNRILVTKLLITTVSLKL